MEAGPREVTSDRAETTGHTTVTACSYLSLAEIKFTRTYITK